MKYGIKRNITVNGDIKTKAELFRTIREITAAGYFFEVRNYFDGKGHSCYMVRVLSHKSES